MNMVGVCLTDWLELADLLFFYKIFTPRHAGYGDDPVGAWLLLRGGPVRHDSQEALPDGPAQPHLLQRDAPPILHHRHRHGRAGNILLVPALQRKVDKLRFVVNCTPSPCTPHSYSSVDDEEAHMDKCVVFLTIWTLWSPNRMLFHFGMVFTRWK